MVRRKIGLLAVALLLVLGTVNRLLDFGGIGKDSQTYVTAITSFFSGENPYEHTIKSYENKDDVGGHGYAYFPGFLYLFGYLYFIALKVGINYDVLWKMCVLLFDLGTAVLIFKHLYKSNYFVAFTGALVWLFNPYLTVEYTNFNHVDPVPVFFCLLALLYLSKDSVLSAVFFTLSVIFKPFALIFLPLFLLKSKNKRAFIVACAVVFIAVSLPFLTSIDDITTYLKGSLFVHSSRVLQGRPFLFYLSYFGKIELFRIIPLVVYSSMATYFGWVLIIAGWYLLKIRNSFVLASMSAINFLIFTPVLNRTYLLWFLPIFIVASYQIAAGFKKLYLFYSFTVGYWMFCYWYLFQWKDGFHVWHP